MRRENLYWLFLSLAVIVADAWSKAYVKKMLFFGMSYTLTPFLSVTLVYNRGSAFGFLNGANGWQTWFFSLLAILVSGALIAWLGRMPNRKPWSCAALALIVGGAIGNLMSRLYYGYVIDFIDFHLGNWHWPAFNIADSALCVGVIILIIEAFVRRR